MNDKPDDGELTTPDGSPGAGGGQPTPGAPHPESPHVPQGGYHSAMPFTNPAWSAPSGEANDDASFAPPPGAAGSGPGGSSPTTPARPLAPEAATGIGPNPYAPPGSYYARPADNPYGSSAPFVQPVGPAGAPTRRGLPVWGIVLIVVGAVAVVGGLIAIVFAASSLEASRDGSGSSAGDRQAVPDQDPQDDPDKGGAGGQDDARDGEADDDDSGIGADDGSGSLASPATPNNTDRQLGAPFAKGECLTGVMDEFGPRRPLRVEDIKAVPCTSAHEAEVLDLVEANPNDKSHGDSSYARYWCDDIASQSVELYGLPFRLRGTHLVASQEEWSKGHTWAMCLGTYSADGYAPLAKPLKELGNGGFSSLTPRGTTYRDSQEVKPGSCMRYFANYGLSAESVVDCDMPHGFQVLGYGTITATNPADAATQANATCQAMADKLPLSQTQRASLRVVPSYNDPPSEITQLTCGIAQWAKQKTFGDATKGAVWPVLEDGVY